MVHVVAGNASPSAGTTSRQLRVHLGGSGGRWWPVSSPRWSTGGCPNREQCGNGALAAQEVRVVCWLHALPSAKNLLLSTGRLPHYHKTVFFFPNINRVATSHLAVDLTREYSGVSGRPTTDSFSARCRRTPAAFYSSAHAVQKLGWGRTD